MSDVGRITEIEPEDGLGWIEMPDGSRVRFGGTACKGFVPTVGMNVEVLGTRPGYGGTVKATELRHFKGAAPAAAPAPSAAAAPSAPRTALHTVQASGIKTDDVLLQLLGLADVSDPVFNDLERLRFELQPTAAAGLDCHNPWFYAIAIDGGGSAYGVYVHPMLEHYTELPWVYWDRELDVLRHVAWTTGELLQGLLASADLDEATFTRLHQTFVKLGMPDERGAPLTEAKADWLPPEDDELRSLAEYQNDPDGAEMERGLLAYASRKRDPAAVTSLEAIYKAWEWTPPAA